MLRYSYEFFQKESAKYFNFRFWRRKYATFNHTSEFVPCCEDVRCRDGKYPSFLHRTLDKSSAPSFGLYNARRIVPDVHLSLTLRTVSVIHSRPGMEKYSTTAGIWKPIVKPKISHFSESAFAFIRVLALNMECARQHETKALGPVLSKGREIFYTL